MADKPIDSPTARQEMREQDAKDMASVIAAGLDATTKTLLFYDKEKRQYQVLTGLFAVAVVSAIGGFGYDLVRNVGWPDPGTDKALSQSIILTQGQQGDSYFAVKDQAGGNTFALTLDQETGNYRLFKLENGDFGDGELTMIQSPNEAAIVMDRISANFSSTAAGESAFVPETFRFGELSNAYKDSGFIQRAVTDIEQGSAVSTTAAADYAELFSAAAENARSGSYGFTGAEQSELREQDDFDARFNEGFLYAAALLFGIRAVRAPINGVTAMSRTAAQNRRRRKENGR